MDEHYYTVEVVSRQVRMTPAAVRRYTRLGLVAPSAWRGRTALYSDADLARLRKVARQPHDLGLNLAGVEIVLRLTDEMTALRREMASWREEER